MSRIVLTQNYERCGNLYMVSRPNFYLIFYYYRMYPNLKAFYFHISIQHTVEIGVFLHRVFLTYRFILTSKIFFLCKYF